MYKFSKDFTKHRKKAKRAVVFRGKPFPWKTRLFQTHIEEFSQYVQNSRLATQFFRTTSGVPYWELWKYHVVSYQFQKITNEIPKSSRLGCFQPTVLLYYMQKTRPAGHLIEEVQQIYLCWEHYQRFVKNYESQVSGK